jgi:hypothetical protein
VLRTPPVVHAGCLSKPPLATPRRRPPPLDGHTHTHARQTGRRRGISGSTSRLQAGGRPFIGARVGDELGRDDRLCFCRRGRGSQGWPPAGVVCQSGSQAAGSRCAHPCRLATAPGAPQGLAVGRQADPGLVRPAYRGRARTHRRGRRCCPRRTNGQRRAPRGRRLSGLLQAVCHSSATRTSSSSVGQLIVRQPHELRWRT